MAVVNIATRLQRTFLLPAGGAVEATVGALRAVIVTTGSFAVETPGKSAAESVLIAGVLLRIRLHAMF